MTVVEVEPSGGYWTEILAPYLKQTGGHYIGAVGGDPAAFKAKYADPAIWGDIAAGRSGRAAGRRRLSRHGHHRAQHPRLDVDAGKLDHALADFHAALKPGGILAVEEHRADPRPMVAEARDGYVATAWLIGAVRQGRLPPGRPERDQRQPQGRQGSSLRRLDPAAHPRSHAKDQPAPADFDPAKYVAIGESDRMTLRFRRV